MATDITAVCNADTYLSSTSSNTNYGSNVLCYNGYHSSIPPPAGYYNTLFKWTLPAGTDAITSVKLYVYINGRQGTPTLAVHELTRTTWTEADATWNKYDGTNAWTVGGGDYSATVVDSVAVTSHGWNVFNLGPGAANPISGLTWGSVIHLLLKGTATSGNSWTIIYSRDYTTDPGKHPYIEITYRPGSSGADKVIDVDDVISFQDVNEVKDTFYGALAPSAPAEGVAWLDSSGATPVLKARIGGAWITSATAETGRALVGMIVPWSGGYFGDGSNGSFSNVLGNTVATANAYLNPLGWWVADGSAVNDAASLIWTGANRYLPNLTDSRFIMGSTAAGTIGGASTRAHVHSFDPGSVTSGNALESSVLANWSASMPLQYTGHTHTLDLPATDSGAATVTENRPAFLACLYIIMVKNVQ